MQNHLSHLVKIFTIRLEALQQVFLPSFSTGFPLLNLLTTIVSTSKPKNITDISVIHIGHTIQTSDWTLITFVCKYLFINILLLQTKLKSIMFYLSIHTRFTNLFVLAFR